MNRVALLTERLVALFALGCLLFGYPLIAVFNTAGAVFGIPVLYAYLFGAWVAFIGAVALVVERTT